MIIEKGADGINRLAVWVKITVSAITIFISLGGAFLGTLAYLDKTFAKSDEIKAIELRVENNILNTFEKQQRVLDMRYLEQLQCQKALMEKELERDPDDRLIETKLGMIKRNIDRMEKIVYQ